MPQCWPTPSACSVSWHCTPALNRWAGGTNNLIPQMAATYLSPVLVALFLPIRCEWLPMTGATALAVVVLAVIGMGVVLGLMTFGFLGLKTAKIVAGVAIVAAAPFSIGFLHEYTVLSASLVAYSVSTLVCYFMSVRNNVGFDFSVIQKRIGDFDDRAEADHTGAAPLLGKKA